MYRLPTCSGGKSVEREPALACDHAGDVVRKIEVRRDARPVAEPEADERVWHRQRDVVLRAEPWQPAIDGGRSDVDRRSRTAALVLVELLQHLPEVGLAAAEIEAREVGVVEETALDAGVANVGGHRLLDPEPREVLGRCRQRLAAGRHCRPAGNQALEQQRNP